MLNYDYLCKSAMKTLAKWSIDDYHRMVEAGILLGRQVELLEGEIVEMSPETPKKISIVKNLPCLKE